MLRVGDVGAGLVIQPVCASTRTGTTACDVGTLVRSVVCLQAVGWARRGKLARVRRGLREKAMTWHVAVQARYLRWDGAVMRLVIGSGGQTAGRQASNCLNDVEAERVALP